jgi:hypothetical protein
MGVYFDLGRPVVGGWLGGGWVLHDPIRDLDLLWGAELGQEGAWLFAIDVDSGQIVEEHPATYCSRGTRKRARSPRTVSRPSATSASPARPLLLATAASTSARTRTVTCSLLTRPTTVGATAAAKRPIPSSPASTFGVIQAPKPRPAKSSAASPATPGPRSPSTPLPARPAFSAKLHPPRLK